MNMLVYLDTEQLYYKIKNKLRSGEITTASAESIIDLFDFNSDLFDLLKELVARTKEENGE